MSSSAPSKVSKWRVIPHPLFSIQLEQLIAEVVKLKKQNPAEYKKKNATKRLQAILKIGLDNIPQDPTLTEYRLGGTLGSKHKHWFRAKFYQRYRLFFRYHTSSRIIILVWVNDEKTKRTYGSDTDAYNVFKKMLAGGNPPDDWENLLKEAQKDSEHLTVLVSKAKEALK